MCPSSFELVPSPALCSVKGFLNHWKVHKGISPVWFCSSWLISCIAIMLYFQQFKQGQEYIIKQHLFTRINKNGNFGKLLPAN